VAAGFQITKSASAANANTAFTRVNIEDFGGVG